MEGLPKWPQFPLESWSEACDVREHDDAVIAYWEARCRLAVEALKVAQQAMIEVQHAQDVGASWYTRGADGLYQQVAMWVRKGRKAANESLAAIGPLPNPQSPAQPE